MNQVRRVLLLLNHSPLHVAGRNPLFPIPIPTPLYITMISAKHHLLYLKLARGRPKSPGMGVITITTLRKIMMICLILAWTHLTQTLEDWQCSRESSSGSFS